MPMDVDIIFKLFQYVAVKAVKDGLFLDHPPRYIDKHNTLFIFQTSVFSFQVIKIVIFD